LEAEVGDELTLLDLVVQGHHIHGLAAPAHPIGQAEAAVLIDHVEELESAAIGCDVLLELQTPWRKRSRHVFQAPVALNESL
jgi:hypothetical protein